MRKIFALVFAALMFSLVACGGEEQEAVDPDKIVDTKEEIENITVVGEIAEIKIDPAYGNEREATLFRVVDNKGKNHYFALGGTVDVLEVGQKLEVKYKLEHGINIYADGREEVRRTYGLYSIASTYEPVKNTDGSTSLESVEWGRPDEVTILPSGISEAIVVSK